MWQKPTKSEHKAPSAVTAKVVVAVVLGVAEVVTVVVGVVVGVLTGLGKLVLLAPIAAISTAARSTRIASADGVLLGCSIMLCKRYSNV